MDEFEADWQAIDERAKEQGYSAEDIEQERQELRINCGRDAGSMSAHERAITFTVPNIPPEAIDVRISFEAANKKAVDEAELQVYKAAEQFANLKAALQSADCATPPSKAARTSGRARTKPKPRPRVSISLTPKQRKALEVVGECKGNISEAARRLDRDRKTVKQHYEAGMRKLGQSGDIDTKTVSIKSDRRGQLDVTREDDRRRG
jgi:hypothetical protein